MVDEWTDLRGGDESTNRRSTDGSTDRRGTDGSQSPPRPGPDALYGPNPTPPQLENGPGWDADPLLVSGCDAYVDGEYLYQDYVYDDHGADTRSVVEPSPDGESLGGFYPRPTGDYRYPNIPDRYAYNAADLLEFRCRPTDDGVAYRITLNTMLEPDAAAVAIGLDTTRDTGGDTSSDTGGDTSSDTGGDNGLDSGGDVGVGTGADGAAEDADRDRRTDWGYGLGDLGAPVDHRLVTWGTGAELDGESLDDDCVAVDVRRNQIEVEVPLDPGEATWRHYLLVGLWDDDAGEFKQIAPRPDVETPGGARAGSASPPVFNVGFRFEEPYRRNLGALDVGQGLLDLVDVTGIGRGLLELALDRTPRVLGEGNWREHRQARALAGRDVSEFHADVDFAKLEAHVTERNVHESGFRTHLYPSRYYMGEGVDPSSDVLEGRLQPYNVYVPAGVEVGVALEEPDPESDTASKSEAESASSSEPTPLVLLLHSLGCAYTQYAVYTPNLVRQVSEERGAVVLMPQARGPGRWYSREGELDVFEAWRDLETRTEIDRSRVSIGGYSMGGFGTYMLAAQCPDLFDRGFSVAGPPTEDPFEGLTGGLLSAPSRLTAGAFGGRGGGDVLNLFSEGPESALDVAANLRHVPLLIWNGAGDPLVPALAPEHYVRRLCRRGYRYQYDLFPTATHLSLGARDRWDRVPEFLARGTVVRNPRRVTYRQAPALDHPEVGLVHDGAYWVDDIRTREGEASGLVDAVSLADGYAEPETRRFRRLGRTPQRHLSRGQLWETPPVESRRDPENALEVRLEGVASATLWMVPAGLDSTEELTLRLESDGPATLILASSVGTHEVDVPEGESIRTVTLDERDAGAGAVEPA